MSVSKAASCRRAFSQSCNRRKKQAAFPHILNTNPQVVDTSRNLLKLLIQRLSRLNSAYDCVTIFMNEQLELYLQGCLVAIEKETILHEDISEGCNNLSSLVSSLLVDHVESCVRFTEVFSQALCGVCELANLLEKFSGIMITDWVKKGEHHVRIAKELSSQNSRTLEDFIGYLPKVADFDCIARIARTVYTTVYRAIHRGTGHQFAIRVAKCSKYTKNQNIRMSLTDRAVSAIAVDALINVNYCVYAVKPESFLTISEYVHPRITVRALLRSKGYFSEKLCTIIFTQVLLALEKLHLCGFIHRDISGSNVCINSEGHCKLIDFDSSKICRGHFTTKPLAQYFKLTSQEFCDKETVGELYYQSPEVVKQRSYGRATDWWSLGILIYKMSTGRFPFKGATTEETITQIVEEALKWPKVEKCPHSATAQLKEYVHVLLKKNPLQRLGSKLYSDLKAYKLFADYTSKLPPGVEMIDKRKVVHTTVRAKLTLNKLIDISSDVNRSYSNASPTIKHSVPNVSDEESSEHIQMYTYVSSQFQKFIDRVRAQGSNFPFCDVLLNKMIPPGAPDMVYLIVRDTDFSVDRANESYGVTETAKKLLELQVDVNLPFTAWCCCYYYLDAEIGHRTGDGRIKYPIIEQCRDLGPDSAQFVQGDILLNLDDVNLLDKSIQDIYASIYQIRTKPSSEWVIRASEKNPYRVIQTNDKSALNDLLSSEMQDVTVSCQGDCFFVRTKQLSLMQQEYCTDNKKLHLIWDVDERMIASPVNPLFGDALLSINGRDTSAFTDQDVGTLFEANTANSLKLLLSSVIRRIDLLEEDFGTSDKQLPTPAHVA